MEQEDDGGVKVFWPWLTGMCMGVGLMVWTKGLSSSQSHLLEFYIIGCVVGLAAAGIASMGGKA